jgi:hypothetical protein
MNLMKIACGMAAGAMLATPQAKADFVFDLINANIPGAGPFAQVDVSLTSSTTATITFTSLTAGGNIYLFGGDAVGVNVNATSWTLGTINGANAGTGFSPGPFSDGGSGTMDGFGGFNQHISSFDGFTHSSDTISFMLTDTSGVWASASSVLVANEDGNLAAAHIFETSFPANQANGAINTGFASGVGVVPEPTTMIAGALLLLPFGASTFRILRKNRV